MLDSRQLVDIGIAINVQVRQAGTGNLALSATADACAVPRIMYEVTKSKIEAQLMKDEPGWSTRYITEHECAIGTAASKKFKLKYIKVPEQHSQYGQ